jgi:beta-glucanase (GH16 family)
MKTQLSILFLLPVLFLQSAGALTYAVDVPEDTRVCYIVGEAAGGWSNFLEMQRIGTTTTFSIHLPDAKTTDYYQYAAGPGWEYEETGNDGKGIAYTWTSKNTVNNWKNIYAPVGEINITASVPEGTEEVYAFYKKKEKEYQLVWNEEFNEPGNLDKSFPLPGDKWYFETGGHGWGNNEAQFYVDRVLGTDTVAKIKDGSLLISAIRLSAPYQGKKYISARMNSKEYWTYGRFEMRAKLPAGRGTWPAFWMLPQSVQSTLDGEIDIMEHVGYDPGEVYFSIHTGAYTHILGTGKQAKKTILDFDVQFHVYAVEWTEDYIHGYIDDERYFTFENDHKGIRETWPFYVPFNLKLNIAIGGDWGGYEDIDDTIFPAVYEIDYVRVYQQENNRKKTLNTAPVIEGNNKDGWEIDGYVKAVKNTNGTFSFTLPSAAEVEYRLYNRKHWEYNETGTNEEILPVRTAFFPRNNNSTVTVAGWGWPKTTSSDTGRLYKPEFNIRVVASQMIIDNVNEPMMICNIMGECLQVEFVENQFISQKLKTGIYIVKIGDVSQKIIIR